MLRAEHLEKNLGGIVILSQRRSSGQGQGRRIWSPRETTGQPKPRPLIVILIHSTSLRTRAPAKDLSPAATAHKHDSRPHTQNPGAHEGNCNDIRGQIAIRRRDFVTEPTSAILG